MFRRTAYIFISIVCWFTILAVSPFVNTQSSRQSFNLLSSNHHSHTQISADKSTFNNDDDSESSNQRRLVARYRVRFLVNRNFELNALLPSGGHIPGFISANIKHLFIRYCVRKASLPGYYSFLFRLSPF